MNTEIRQQFLDAMSRAACTVSIVTTDGAAGRAGVTVSAMAAVSVEAPSPSLLVCLHHLSPACPAIQDNGAFCVNVLRDDQAAISDTFAGRLKTPDGDKFSCSVWTKGKCGVPILTDGLTAFECGLKHTLTWGTHCIFIGEVESVILNEHVSPLLYSNRRYGTSVPIMPA